MIVETTPSYIGETKVVLYAYVGPNARVVQTFDLQQIYPRKELFVDVVRRCPSNCNQAIIWYGSRYLAIDLATVALGHESFSTLGGVSFHKDLDAAIMAAVLSCSDKSLGPLRFFPYPSGPTT